MNKRESERMKANMVVKLGISMLVMLTTIGTVSASGGASYSQAQSISVPDGDTMYGVVPLLRTTGINSMLQVVIKFMLMHRPHL